jgi:hypothetical protein
MADSHYYQKVANHLRMEMDTRSPKLRLSVVGYLVDAGYLPSDPNFLNMVREIMEYIGLETEEYLEGVAQLVDPVDPIQADEPNAYDVLKRNPNPYL